MARGWRRPIPVPPTADVQVPRATYLPPARRTQDDAFARGRAKGSASTSGSRRERSIVRVGARERSILRAGGAGGRGDTLRGPVGVRHLPPGAGFGVSPTAGWGVRCVTYLPGGRGGKDSPFPWHGPREGRIPDRQTPSDPESRSRRRTQAVGRGPFGGRDHPEPDQSSRRSRRSRGGAAAGRDVAGATPPQDGEDRADAAAGPRVSPTPTGGGTSWRSCTPPSPSCSWWG